MSSVFPQFYQLPGVQTSTFNGYLDRADCNFIGGWAWDSSQPGASISVNIFDGNAHIATVTADQFRSDLTPMGGGHHAFNFPTPASLKDGQPHSIRVKFAANGNDLRSTPKPLTCGNDGYIDRADCNFIGGWAWNSNQPNTAVNVDIYDGEDYIATVSANQFRQDLLNAGKGNGSHGFHLPTPASLKDGHEHSIRAVIAGTDSTLKRIPGPFACGGQYDGYLDRADCEFIGGWGWDSTQPNAAVSVNIYDGDNLIATVSASQFRQDLLNAGKGNGSHGFHLPTPASLKDGRQHWITAKFNASGVSLKSGPKSLSCSTVQATFDGYLDRADCEFIGGWAWDSSQPNSAINVDIYDGTTHIGTTTASQFRQDLLNAGKGNGSHGFHFPTPASLKDGNSHSIHVKFSANGEGLKTSPKSLSCGAAQSQFDGYHDTVDCDLIRGWAWDSSQPNAAVSVDIYDGAALIATVSASQFRQDLLNAGKGNGNHAFNYSTPASLKNGQPHSVRVKFTANGSDLKTTPKTFNSTCGGTSCQFSVGQGVGGSELSAFQNAHGAAGGQSALGCPTAAVRFDGFTSFAGTTSHYQTFANGDIEYLATGTRAGQAYAIINPLFGKWASFGFNANHPLGYPIDVLTTGTPSCYGTSLRYQSFEGGSLTHHLSGSKSGSVYEVHGAIHSKWAAKGFAGCPLGMPTSDESTAQPSGSTGKTGRLNQFEGGQIYWFTNASQAFEVHGAIYNTYVGMGGSASWLGFPISDEFVAPTGFARSNFEGGYITTTNGVNYQAFTY